MARLVELYKELAALGREDDCDVVRRVVEFAQAPMHASPTAPTVESTDDRKRRLARERQQRARDRQQMSRSERDVRVTMRDNGQSVERDERVTQRDASRVTQRDVCVTLRDEMAEELAPEFAQGAANAALTATAPATAPRDTERDAQRDVMRDASRNGGLGGVVVVKSESLPTIGTTTALYREDLTTTQQNTARESRTERDELRDASRVTERDSQRDVDGDLPKHLVAFHRPAIAASSLAPRPLTSLLDHPVMASTSAKLHRLSQSRKARDTQRSLECELVFRYWVSKCGKDRALLTREREDTIRKQLDLNGGNVSELCYAIDGLVRSSFHMGANEAKRKHDDVSIVFRDRGQVEKFAADMAGWRADEEHPFVRDTREALTPVAVSHG